MSKKTNQPSLRLDQMRALVETQKQERAKACKAELDKVLGPLMAKYNCQLQPVPFITPDGKIAAQLAIVALDDPAAM